MNNIVSRWFIVNSKKIREGQYAYSLYRDLIADYYSIVVNAPAFIEKATIGLNDPMIFNSENMTFNQIKETQTPLKDKFGYPWVVGYIDRKTAETTITIPRNEFVVDYDLESLEEYDYYAYKDTAFRDTAPRNVTFGLYCSLVVRGPLLFEQVSNYTVGFDINGNLKNPGDKTYLQTGVSVSINTGLKVGYKIAEGSLITQVAEQLPVAAKSFDWKNIDLSPYTPTPFQNIANESGKIIKAGDTYYRVNVVNAGITLPEKTVVDVNSELGRQMTAMVGKMSSLSEQLLDPYFVCMTQAQTYKLEFNPIDVDSYILIIPSENNRIHCQNAPYDIFAMPYGDYRLVHKGKSKSSIDKNMMMRMMQQLQITLGSELYDLQLLPYCPLFPEMISSRKIDTAYLGADIDKYVSTVFPDDNQEAWTGAIFWMSNADFEQDIVTGDIQGPTDGISCKLMSETRVYRLCSPNYSSVFEINAAKNGGLHNFKAYCSYKPFTPYIQVAPEFNRLYGKNFKDARGLICGGDFSLPRTSSAWVEFELNNKNYQINFDRQIENLEINNSLAQQEAKVQAIVGVAQGVTTGAVTGLGAGGVYGAAIGGVAGGVASAIGAAADWDILQKKQAENLDFTKDQFGYALGNIGAQPRTLTKVSAFNINNQIFPFLEVYGATIEEEVAFENKLKYNGMTVMAIGTISQYLQEEPSYIKGKIIRLEGLDEDYHVALAISEEINKGVYI